MGFGHGFRNGNDKIGLVFVFICQAVNAFLLRAVDGDNF